MKAQTLLSFIILFFAASISAQPAQYNIFNPADLCKYKEGKTIFVGRVVSTETVSKDSLPEYLKDLGGDIIKYIVSVEKVFSGQIKLKEIEDIFLVKDLQPGLVINDESIFIFDESPNNSKFLTKLDWSSPLNNYSAEEKAIRFSQIEARINRFPKSPPFTGIVLQTDASPAKRSLELSVLFGHEAEIYKSVAGITIKAKSKKTGQVFKTTTNEKGVFTFNNLEDGDYALSMVFPRGFEQGFTYEQYKDYENVVSVNKTNCGVAKAIFKIRKIRKQGEDKKQ